MQLKLNNQKQIDLNYRYWRRRLMISMIIGYAAFYLTRKSMNFAMPVMQLQLGLDKTDIGLLATAFYITYGCSKFISGIFIDRTHVRWVMGLGLAITGVLNIIFAFCYSLPGLVLVWALNGFFQGWGWPPCAKLLTSWYSRNERGLWWGGWNASINIGGALAPLLCGYLATIYGWQAALLMPGLIAIILGLWLARQPLIKPQQLGLPSVGRWRNDPLELRQEKQSPAQPVYRILRDRILLNKTIWLLGLAYALVYLIRMALNDWGNIWLSENQNINLVSANATLSLFEFGGLLGALMAGWGSDLLFKGQRAPMIILFAIGLFITVAALWLAPKENFILSALCFFSIGFFVFGPQMLIGLAATENTHKDAAGSVTGFLGLFAYFGAALSGWPISLLINAVSWSGFFTLLTVAATAIGFLLIPLMITTPTINTTKSL